MPEFDERYRNIGDRPGYSTESGPIDTTSISFQSFDDSPNLLDLEKLAAKELKPGDWVGDKYQIVELICSGGMGSVYKGIHRELGKQVAIKVLLVDKLVKDVTYRRFEREAKSAGLLSHPNIVSVYDYGMISPDRPYIVMELLDGMDLDELLVRRGYLEPNLFLSIFTQVCEALSYAHAMGLVHRDLKPSNIMLVGQNQNRQYVKIIDFGIAKFSPKKPETKPITKPGQIFGSPLYMSPEQCVGQKLDPRSDIYSLGCVMYESLCGAPPFMGDTLLSTIYKHVNEPPPPLQEHSYGRKVPGALEKIVFKMLQKHPEDRFQSANEVLTALEQFRASQERAASTVHSQPTLLDTLKSNKQIRFIFAIAVPILIAIACKAAIDLLNQNVQRTHIAHPRAVERVR